jgi:hypothetical protein
MISPRSGIIAETHIGSQRSSSGHDWDSTCTVHGVRAKCPNNRPAGERERERESISLAVGFANGQGKQAVLS